MESKWQAIDTTSSSTTSENAQMKDDSEADETRGVSSMARRMRGSILALWNGFCLFTILNNWGATSEIDRRRLALYFFPYLPFCVMLWLWSVNVRVFERLHVPYEKLFGAEDSKFLLRGEQLTQLAMYLVTILSTAVSIFLSAIAVQAAFLADWVPLVLLGCVLVVLFCPFPSSLRSSHAFFVRTLRRVMLPIQSVTFADFLMADVMTSLARALADLEHSVCYVIVHYRQPLVDFDTAMESCNRGALHTNLFLAMPYLIRMIQCLWVFISEGDQLQLCNAVKYLTTLPVIASSMMKHHTQDVAAMDFWVRMWFLASLVNTAFSFFWDVEMDWDITWFRNDKSGASGWLPRLQPDSIYSPKVLYYFAMVSNFAIRIAWIYKLSVHLHYSLAVQLVVALLEVLRRCQWAFLRIECGLRKLTKAHALKDVHTKV